MADKSYDFKFIVKSLGLTSIVENSVAVNVGAITSLKATDDAGLTVYIHGGQVYDLSEAEAVKLETLLQERIAQGKIDYEENAEFQMVAQHRAGKRAEQSIMRVQGVINTVGNDNRRPWGGKR